MAYDRPSWREIDKMKDQPGRAKRKERKPDDLREHSTRYARYKADLDRLFDQGLASELLKKLGKESSSETDPEPETVAESKPAKARSKKEAPKLKTGRIPTNHTSTNRNKLIRNIIDAENNEILLQALDELLKQFGMPDDWEVLVRVVEHRDEEKILMAVEKMKQLLPGTKKVPRRYSLKERLRTIGQTAQNTELRRKAKELEAVL